MRHPTCTLILATLLLAAALPAADTAALRARLAGELTANPAIDAKVKAFATDTLLTVISDPALIAEVKAQNAKRATLDEIKAIDAAWSAAEDELPIQREKLGNAAATAIKAMVAKHGALREVFAMDAQGANVGQNLLTSDYWQGDEDKWSKSFAGGAGGIDVGKPKFDKSANATLQQVSLPLVDADGTVVGAITFGIAIDAL
jgi:hypothetical protein